MIHVALSTTAYGQLYAVVDDCDSDVLQYTWHVLFTDGKFYAYRQEDRSSILLHRHIMKPADGVKIDHINGNGLDCRRSNLRLATSEQNRWNSRRKRSKAGYIGVKAYTVKNGVRYQAKLNGGHIGSYDTPEEAARAYDRYASNLYGAFAVLNFPTEQQPCHQRNA